MRRLLALLLCCLWLPTPIEAEERAAPIRFHRYAKATFERAKKERRIIVMTVSTTWCHWCHVMKRETYGDARVKRLLAARFLPVDVDADARPDLAERFRNYRWPATAFLTPDGAPILALRGYRSPDAYLEILADVQQRVARGGPYPGFDDPNASRSALPDVDQKGLIALRDRLLRQLDRYWDPAAKGWGKPQKYPVAQPIELGLLVAHKGGRARVAEDRALATLRAMRALLDLVDGGMYQYSLEGRWDRWHPEKIMEVNAGALCAYADAYRHNGQRAHLDAARTIHRWLRDTMRTPEGTYRTSQDADAPRLAGERYYRIPTKAGRRPYGTPKTDDHIYARENGLVVQALVRLHRATGDAALLEDARKAAMRILTSHAVYIGLLRHDAEDDVQRLFLLDQVEMGRALLALHQADLDERWLGLAQNLAEALPPGFGSGADKPAAGFFDATPDPDAVGYLAKRRRSLVGNARAARFLLTLSAITSEPSFRRQGLAAIRAVGRADVVRDHWRNIGDLAIAVEQALAPYATVTVTGPAGSAEVDALVSRVRQRMRTRPWIHLRRTDGPSVGAVVCGATLCSDSVKTSPALDRAIDAALSPNR